MILFLIYITILSFAGFTLFNQKGQKTICIFLSLLLTLLAGFRSENTGFDYQQYISFINFISNENDILGFLTSYFSIEPLFILSSYTITNVFELNFVAVFVLYAILGVFLKALAFNKLSPLPVVTLLLYYQAQYFYSDFAQIRQSVAMTFFLFSIYTLWKNKLFLSVLLLLLASLNHYSAIACFIIYPLKYIYDNVKTSSLFSLVFLLLVTSIAFSFLDFKFSSFLSQLVPIDILSQKIDGYSNSEYSDYISFGISDIVRIITCFLIYMIIVRKKQTDVMFLSYLYIIGCVFFFFLKNDGILASRITSYYKILDCIIIPQIIFYLLSNKKSEITLRNIFITFILLLSYSSLSFYKNVVVTPEIYNYEVIN